MKNGMKCIIIFIKPTEIDLPWFCLCGVGYNHHQEKDNQFWERHCDGNAGMPDKWHVAWLGGI